MFGILLQNRWQQRKAYIMRWILFGAIGSVLTSLLFSMFRDIGLASNIAGIVLVSALSGFGMSLGLSWGELFDGWLRVAIRVLASNAIVIFSIAAANLVLIIAYQSPGIQRYDVITVIISYTLAAGLGMSLGEFLPKYSGIGHLVFGCLVILLINYFMYGLNGSAVISFGVVIGTGIARSWNK